MCNDILYREFGIKNISFVGGKTGNMNYLKNTANLFTRPIVECKRADFLNNYIVNNQINIYLYLYERQIITKISETVET